MSVWDYLFEPKREVTLEISSIERDKAALHAAVESVAGLRRDLAAAQRQIDRLELVCEALVSLLEARGHVERPALVQAIHRLDLADGVEDSRLGPDLSADAPKCPECHRPVNPRRGHCIYCFATLERCAESRDTIVPRPVCARCGILIDQDVPVPTDEGVLCQPCFLADTPAGDDSKEDDPS